MDYEALRAALQNAVPFNTHVGLVIAEIGEGAGVVRLPDTAATRNHVGSQHAGALFAAGEAASGAAFVGAFAERLGDITPLAEEATITYRKVAQGTITARGELSEPGSELLGKLDDEGGVRFCVDVVLSNAHGDCVAEMSVNWNVRVKS